MSDIDELCEFNNLVGDKGGVSCSSGDVEAKYTSWPYQGDSPETVVNKTAAINAKMWAQFGDSNYSACEKAVTSLPPGQYTVEANSQIGIYFSRTQVSIDELMDLPDSASEAVINEITDFWTKEQHFRKFGFLWKRGVLMWGPPGSGKTSTVQQISKRVIDKGGIAIYVTRPDITATALKMLRAIEPKRPIVVMLEDVDAIIQRHGESDLLALMDGELQIDNVVFVATTNYPERLDKRFINRPSRFDIVKKIGMPSEAARAVYLKTKNERLKDDPTELSLWVTSTKDFSIAHMKELIVSVEVFGIPLKQAVDRLKTMMEHQPNSFDRDHKLGFTID